VAGGVGSPLRAKPAQHLAFRVWGSMSIGVDHIEGRACCLGEKARRFSSDPVVRPAYALINALSTDHVRQRGAIMPISVTRESLPPQYAATKAPLNIPTN
jgi:hypothetical protein